MFLFVQVLKFGYFFFILTTEQFVLLRKMRGQEINRRLTDNQPRASIQTANGSYLNDAAALERENEDLKVFYTSERFSIDCPKTETKTITLANHDRHGQSNEPIANLSKYM